MAASAGLSVYHLHRLFTAVFGHSIKTYVRKRRLTEAAVLLRTTKRGVLDVALACQFESQAAFTRAFRALFGQPPAQFRREGRAHWYVGMPRATFESMRHLRSGVTHEPELRELRESLTLQGFSQAIDLELEGELVKRWVELAAETSTPSIVYGAGLELTYLAGTDVKEPWPFRAPPTHRAEVPTGRYAVFQHCGALEQINATVDFIWATWLPRSGFTKSTRPDVERFELQELATGKATMELWISVD